MNGKIRIGGAFVVGVIVILGSLYVKDSFATDTHSPEGEIAVADTTNEAQVITPLDTNRDGIPDWKESLVSEDINKNSTSTDTFTETFTQALLQDYLTSVIDGSPLDNKDEIVTAAINAIEHTVTAPVPNITLTLVDTNNPVTLREYGNTLALTLFSAGENTESELEILARALETEDPAELQKLTAISDSYKKLIQDLTQLQVPRQFETEHRALIHAISAVQFDIEGMTKSFKDPLTALAHVTNYQEHGDTMLSAVARTNRALSEAGITFTKEDPGILLSFFTI